MKDDPDLQLHITFMRPMRVKLRDHSTQIVAIDATFDVAVNGISHYKTDRVYPVERDDDGHPFVNETGVAFRTMLAVPVHNLAGFIPQPFQKER